MLLRSQLIYNHIIRPNVIDRFNVVSVDCLPKIERIRVSCKTDTTNLGAGICLIELITGQRSVIQPVRGVKAKFIKDWYEVFVDLRRFNMYVFLDWFLMMTVSSFRGRSNVKKKFCSLVVGSVGFTRASVHGMKIQTVVKDDVVCVKMTNMIPFLLRVGGSLISKQIILELDDFMIEVFIKKNRIGCSADLVANTLLSPFQIL